MRATIIEDEILGKPTKAETKELYDEWCEQKYGNDVEKDIEELDRIHNPMMRVVERVVKCPIEGAAQIRIGGASEVVGDFPIESDAFYALERLYQEKMPAGYRARLGSKALSLNRGHGELEDTNLPLLIVERPTDELLSQDLGE